jgi:hypothetical protein
MVAFVCVVCCGFAEISFLVVTATASANDDSEFGTVSASCIRLQDDITIVLASSPGSRTIQVTSSGCVLDDLFHNVLIDNSSLVGACETYDSPYQLVDTQFSSTLIVLSPDTSNCASGLSLGVILGVTFGCIAAAIIAMLLVFLYMRYRQRKMVRDLTARSSQLQRSFFISRQLSAERNSLRAHEELGTGFATPEGEERIDFNSSRTSSRSSEGPPVLRNQDTVPAIFLEKSSKHLQEVTAHDGGILAAMYFFFFFLFFFKPPFAGLHVLSSRQ